MSAASDTSDSSSAADASGLTMTESDSQAGSESESGEDIDEFMEHVDPMEDWYAYSSSGTTAWWLPDGVHYDGGEDLQKVPWRLFFHSRDQYRRKRIREYLSTTNFPITQADIRSLVDGHAPQRYASRRLYSFRSFDGPCPLISHFQLRNLLWCPNANDIYMSGTGNKILHYDTKTNKHSTVLNTSGSTQAENEGIDDCTFHRIDIGTLCVHENVLLVGGFKGELVGKNLTDGQRICYEVPDTGTFTNAIVNSIEIRRTRSGVLSSLCASNDCFLRIHDISKWQLVSQHELPWAVNHASISPEGRRICVVGDDKDVRIMDAVTFETIDTLSGHIDYGFASAWHPGGDLVATGNQDHSTMVWDTRITGRGPVYTALGRISAIRALRFSPDGAYLAAAESADFLHIYDVQSGFTVKDELDVFGEFSGIAFSNDPLGQSLYAGVVESQFWGVLQIERGRSSAILDHPL